MTAKKKAKQEQKLCPILYVPASIEDQIRNLGGFVSAAQYGLGRDILPSEIGAIIREIDSPVQLANGVIVPRAAEYLLRFVLDRRHGI